MKALHVKRDGTQLLLEIPKEITVPVTVYYSEQPEEIQSENNSFILNHSGWQKVPELAPSNRFYFTINTQENTYIGAERRLPFEHLYNCRDLGGYETTTGRLTRFGKVYRSDALHQIDPYEQSYLENMGIQTIVDFRSPEEITKDANQPIAHAKTFNFNPHAMVAQQASTQRVSRKDEEKIAHLEQMVQTESGRKKLAQQRNIMVQQMKNMVIGEPAIKAYQQFFEVLLNKESTPLIFHCQGGKDRTGWGAALYLAALGVPKKTIYHDYLLTGELNAPRNDKRMAIYKKYTKNQDVLAYLASLQQTKEEYLDGAYDEVETTYGNMTNYLQKVIKLTTNQLQELRGLYLY